MAPRTKRPATSTTAGRGNLPPAKKARLATVGAERSAAAEERPTARVTRGRGKKSTGQSVRLREDNVNETIEQVIAHRSSRSRSTSVDLEASTSAPNPDQGMRSVDRAADIAQASINVVRVNTNDAEARNFDYVRDSQDASTASIVEAIKDTLRVVRDAASETDSRAANRFAKKKLPDFNGDALEWVHFKECYRETANGFSDRENIARLFKALQGEARDTVQVGLATTNDPESIIETLERFFGRRNKVAERIVREIQDLPGLESGNSNIARFATKLKNAVIALKARNLIGYLYSPDLLKSVVNKIPASIKYSYNRYAAKAAADLSDLEKLTNFLDEEAELALSSGILDLDFINIPANPTTSNTTKRPAKHSRTHETVCTASAIERETERVGSKSDCPLCNKSDHELHGCNDFAKELRPKRWRIASRLGLCFLCLRKGHRCENYAESASCKICNRRHHHLLHMSREERLESWKNRESERTNSKSSSNEKRVPEKKD